MVLYVTFCSMFVACNQTESGRKTNADSTQTTRQLTEEAARQWQQDQADSAMATLLTAADYGRGCRDALTRYRLHALFSTIYESKNLSQQQQYHQRMMLAEAEKLGNSQLQSEAHSRIAATHMVTGQLDSAATEARIALQTARKDTLDYRAQTLLLLCQIYLQQEQADSASYYLVQARSVWPGVTDTDLYRLSHVYVLSAENDTRQLMALLRRYADDGSIYARTEMLRLQLAVLEQDGRWNEALAVSKRMTALTDSVADAEASASMTRIHALQHEQQLQLAEERSQKELAAQRARHSMLIIGVLLLLLAACVTGLFYRRRATLAHAGQIEAMRLAEEVQANAEQVKAENLQLQKLYYEHLYAIILPILNARRSKNGHINLEEDAWTLIERNTDMVLLGFTTRLRRQHPTLSVEDMRFCCLIMMRVPNAILADIYGIASTSVAMRKQRMKKKFDDIMHEQTLENYLNQYGL